jgi:(S)-sulfolactate dehydrogenase
LADIVITEFMDASTVRSLSTDFDVVYDPALVDRRGDLLALVDDARGLIVRNRTVVDGDLLTAAPRLQVLGRLGVGLDNIDLKACEEHSVLVRPAFGANADAVAEYVIAAVLSLVRGAFLSTALVVAGVWPRTEMDGLEVAGRTMGLVGLGDISRRVAARASALGMQVCAHDPYLAVDDAAWDSIENVGLAHLISQSDAISIHVPLTNETAALFDSDAIRSMRPGAVLVNTARGGIVDEEALADALREHRIRGAAIDVFEHEPVDRSIGQRFENVPNLILTPHIAGVTEESNLRVSQMTEELVRVVLEGDSR